MFIELVRCATLRRRYVEEERRGSLRGVSVDSEHAKEN